MAARPCDVLLVGEQTAHVVRLAAGLLDHGLTVASLNAPRLATQLQRQAGWVISDHTVPALRLRGRYRFPWLRGLERWALRTSLRQLLAAVRPSIIHINSIAADHAVFTELGEACPPIVASVWGTDVHTVAVDGSRQQRRDIARVLRHAAVITADAPYMLDRVREITGPRPHSELRLALFGIDVERFSACDPDALLRWSLRLDLEPRAPVVLAPRRINPRYHPQRVLEAFARSSAAARGHLVFKLFGDNPREEPQQQAQLLTRADELGVQERLRFAPACPYSELPALYQLADVACFLLDRDGTPSTAMELWAAGVPMVASNIPHYRDVMISRHNAVLVDPADVASAAGALDDVLAQPARAQVLAERGRQWVRQHATTGDMLQGMLSAYHEAGLPAAGSISRTTPRSTAGALPAMRA